MDETNPPDFQSRCDEPAREIIRERLLLRPKLGREIAFSFMTTHGIPPELALAYCCYEQRARDRRRLQGRHRHTFAVLPTNRVAHDRRSHGHQ